MAADGPPALIGKVIAGEGAPGRAGIGVDHPVALDQQHRLAGIAIVEAAVELDPVKVDRGDAPRLAGAAGDRGRSTEGHAGIGEFARLHRGGRSGAARAGYSRPSPRRRRHACRRARRSAAVPSRASWAIATGRAPASACACMSGAAQKASTALGSGSGSVATIFRGQRALRRRQVGGIAGMRTEKHDIASGSEPLHQRAVLARIHHEAVAEDHQREAPRATGASRWALVRSVPKSFSIVAGQPNVRETAGTVTCLSASVK